MAQLTGSQFGPFEQVDDDQMIALLGTLDCEVTVSDGTATPAMQNQGPRTWRYVKNDEAATDFAEGDVIAYKNGESRFMVVQAGANSASARVVGVAAHTIPFGKYGWIIAGGKTKVRAGAAGFTANSPLIVGVAAAVAIDAAAITDASFAFSHEAAAAGALGVCHIQCLSR